jgi:hypothetical protein
LKKWMHYGIKVRLRFNMVMVNQWGYDESYSSSSSKRFLGLKFF